MRSALHARSGCETIRRGWGAWCGWRYRFSATDVERGTTLGKCWRGAALTVLVLAALASDAWGQSQRPPDTEQAKRAQEPPAIDQRGAAQSPARSSAPAPPHSSQIYFSERPHRLHRKVMKSGLVSLTSCPATIMSVPQSGHAGSSPVSKG